MSVLPVITHANTSTPIWASASSAFIPGPTGPVGPTGPPASFTFYRGTITTSGGTGNSTVTLSPPYPSSAYTVYVAMEDTNPAQMSVNRLSASQFQIYWANAGGGSHTIAWLTAG